MKPEKETRLSNELWRRRMTQAELARATGIDRAVISRLARGVMQPFPKYRTLIADALAWEGDPMELFGEVSEDASPAA